MGAIKIATPAAAASAAAVDQLRPAAPVTSSVSENSSTTTSTNYNIDSSSSSPPPSAAQVLIGGGRGAGRSKAITAANSDSSSSSSTDGSSKAITTKGTSLNRPLTPRELQYFNVKETSLGCLTVTNPLRALCLRLTRSMLWEYFIVFCVLVNVCILAAYEPTDTENAGGRNKANEISEPIFTAIFTFEMLVKIIALDLWGEPNGYLTDGWNLLDGVIVLLCYIQLAPNIGNVQSIRTIRLIRVLRTMRMEAGEIAMNTVAAVIPQMLNVMTVVLFIILTFGMFALMLFTGVNQGKCAYDYHNTAGINDPLTTFWSTKPCSIDCSGPFASETCTITTGDSCGIRYFDGYTNGNYGRVPSLGECRRGPNPDTGFTNFDNVGASMLTWFVISTQESWSTIMYNLWHSFGAPVFIALFFVAFITIVPFFLYNLFTAAFITKYSEVARQTREKRRKEAARAAALGGVIEDASTSNAAASASSEESNGTGAVHGSDEGAVTTAFTNPLHAASSSKSNTTAAVATASSSSKRLGCCACWEKLPGIPAAISKPLQSLTNHWAFNSTMTLIIIANAILLACDAAGTSDEYNNNLNTANLVFVAIFTFEMFCKLLALGMRGYVSVPFNIFDGVIVIISIIEAIIVSLAPELLQGGGTSALRAFRLLRVLKLAKKWTRLNKILTAIGAAVPPGSAALLVMMIIMTVFALMGMQLFGGHYTQAVADGKLATVPRANFNTLWWALVTSFWTMTSENWDYILHSHMALNGIEAFLFFAALVAIGTFVFANMYVAILLDSAGPSAQAAAAADDAANGEHMDGGLPARLMKLARLSVRFAGAECRDRWPNRGKAFGYCACDCLEDGSLEDGAASKSGGSEKQAVDDETTNNTSAAKTSSSSSSKFKKPSVPVEYLPVAPASTSRVDIVSQDGVVTGAVIYAPASADTLAPKSVFADPDDPVNAPPLSAAGMRIQVLTSGDTRVIPQAPERLPCDAPLSRKKQLELGELVSVEAENRNRSVRGRIAKKWRAGLGATSQFILSVFGRRTHDALMMCGRALGVVPSNAEDDVLVEISAEKLKEEADAANVKLNLNVRKTFTPKNLRRPTPHESLGCVTYDAPVRMWALRLTSHPLWERMTMTIILLSTINLALAEPWTDTCDPDADANCGRMTRYLYGTDVFITLYFCVELFLKVLAQGAFFDQDAYFTDSWNCLDGAIVVVSVISLSVESGPVRALRAFRALRALRPLRMVSRLPGLKLVVNTLLQSLPKLCEICIVSFLFMFIFAIIGTQNFKGAIAVCNDMTITDPAACTGYYTLRGDSCAMLPTLGEQNNCYAGTGPNAVFPRRWESLPRNYDDIAQSLLTVWELGTAEDWPQRMVEAVDAVGEGKAMQRDFNPAAALYFLVVQIVIAWTCFSFFTVIVFDTYNDLKSNAQGTRLLTHSQRAWVDNLRLTLLQKPRPSIRPPPGIRNAIFNLVKSKPFEWMIMLMIVGNVVALACTKFGMDHAWSSGIEYANYAFTLVFTFEAILKVIGLGWKQYIRSDWHKFDLFLVIAAIISAAVSIDASIKGERLAGTPIATLLRILRIARLFRMVKASKGLQRVVRTLIFALPAMGNVFGILSLLWFIWSIVGMQIFSNIRYGDWARYAFREGQTRAWLNEDANFDSFPIAFMTVFRISTGDDFNGIMRDLMVDVPYCEATGGNPNCGDKVLPPLFFIACHFITFFVAIKLFLVTVADAYNAAVETDSTTSEVYKLTSDVAGAFRRAWVTLDEAATSYLPPAKLEALVWKVDAPLGLRVPSSAGAAATSSSHQQRREARAFVNSLAVIPDARGMCHFHAVLHALVARASNHGTAGSKLAAVGIWGQHASVLTALDEKQAVAKMCDGSSAAKSHKKISWGLSLAELSSIIRIQATWRGYASRKHNPLPNRR